MASRIQHRLFLALLAAAGLAVIGMFVIMQWSIDRGFLRYVNTLEQTRLVRLAERLEGAYGERESWDFLRKSPLRWLQLLVQTLPEGAYDPQQVARLERRLEHRKLKGRGSGRFPPDSPPPSFEQTFTARVFLRDARGHLIMGPRGLPAGIETRPLVHRGQTVGFLGLLPAQQLSDAHQLRFVEQQKLALALIAGAVLLISALLSFPLSRRLVRPVEALAAATRRLAGGDYGSRVRVAGRDELGRLAADFNALALTLEKNEQMRRQWIADISHELRTPLAVLRGEIEALQDGVREANVQTVGSLHGEVLRLSRLVDDLYELSLSDIGALSYRKRQIDLAGLLRDAADEYRTRFAQKRIALHLDIPASRDLLLFADPERLHQLLANLLDNALKYTDPGGRANVGLTADNGSCTLDIQDSPPGVSDADRLRLFERLYRAEHSRSRALGGAGLGLAICSNIVTAHGGTIEAFASPLGGLWIRIQLPEQGGRG